MKEKMLVTGLFSFSSKFSKVVFLRVIKSQNGKELNHGLFWQAGQTNDERVTAFIDGASKFVAQQFGDSSNPSYFTEPVINRSLPHVGLDQVMEQGTSGLANMSDVSSQRTPLVIDQAVQGRYTASETKGEQLSDTQSDSSLSAIQTNFATLPQYDFYMSATKLAAFLALFNLTKHKLESAGFAV